MTYVQKRTQLRLPVVSNFGENKSAGKVPASRENRRTRDTRETPKTQSLSLCL